jgi:hypothetical protein
VLHRHDDRAGPILLAHDPRNRAGFEVDAPVALGEAAFPRVRARVKAPRGNPVNGGDLRAGRGCARRAGHAAECQQSRQRQEYEPDSRRDVAPPHPGAIIDSAAIVGLYPGAQILTGAEHDPPLLDALAQQPGSESSHDVYVIDT